MSDGLHEVVQGHDQQRDLQRDLQQQIPVPYSLLHLTLSDTAMEFFSSNPNLSSLKPLADQIISTNYLNDQGVLLYKALVDSIIIKKKLQSNEDDQDGYATLDTVRIYLHALIEGCKGGYRGRLVTEMKRVYSAERKEPEKRRWSLW